MAGLEYAGDLPAVGVADQDDALLVLLAGLGEEVAQVGDAVAAEGILRHFALLGQDAEVTVDVADHIRREFHAAVAAIQDGDGGEIKRPETVVRQNAKGIIARGIFMEICLTLGVFVRISRAIIGA